MITSRGMRPSLVCIAILWTFCSCGRQPAVLGADALPNDGFGPDLAPSRRFVEVAVGVNVTCAIRDDERMVCWGDRAGNHKSLPGGRFRSVAVSAQHGCAIRETGQVICWGLNDHGQASAPPGLFSAVAVSLCGSCGLRPTGLVECWGSGSPKPLDIPRTRMISLSVACQEACSVTEQHTASCWTLDPVAYGSPWTPPDPFAAVVAGGGHQLCGLRAADQSISCWSSTGPETRAELPGERFEQVGVGYEYGCALKADGSIRCWGGGQPDPSDPPPSRAHPPPGSGYVKLSVGSGHACAIHRDGHIDCWGDNRYGQLEAPDPNSVP